MTDTGRFSYDNTSAAALRDAADMVDAGVSPATDRPSRLPESVVGVARHRVAGLSRLTLANHGHVAYAWLTDADFAELDVLPEEAENLPDAIRVIGGIDAAVLLRQHATEVRVNLRSKTGADVGRVAAHFGGGGHRAASGFTFEGDIETLMPVLSAAASRWRRGVSAKRGQTDLSGVLLVDKPSGMTSHDVVDRVRRATGERRVGHAGTLDPMATGLLVVLVGPAARLGPLSHRRSEDVRGPDRLRIRDRHR